MSSFTELTSSKRLYLELDKLQKKSSTRPNDNIQEHLKNMENVPNNLTSILSFSLQKYKNFVYDQGDLGSCTANAACSAYKVLNNIKHGDSFEPSRLFYYYNERVLEGTISQDSGADVVDGEKFSETHGICSEQLWPYDISKFSEHPTAKCYHDAVKHKIKKFSVIPVNAESIIHIKSILVSKIPVLLAIAIYESFESETVSTTGIVPMPNTDTEKLLGGHEVLIIGFDDSSKRFLVANSWGPDFGIPDKTGTFYLPYDYILNTNLTYELTYFII